MILNEKQSVLDDFIFFFKHKDKVYGASESSRLTFAKMKDKKDEDGKNPKWVAAANFVANDLKEKSQTVFGKKDLEDIKVIDREKAEKML